MCGNVVVDFSWRRRHVEDSLDELQLPVIAGLGEVPEFLKCVGFDEGEVVMTMTSF
jgi:hypothetical protein